MSFTRKSIADHLDSYDDEIATIQEGKRETLADYRQQLADAGMSKGGIKAEIEALKVAMRRRRAIAKKGEEVVEEADVLADEIFAEITSRAPRATRVREDIEEFDADTGEVIEDQPETATGTHERPSNNDKAYPEAGPQAEASLAGTGSGMLADREGRHEGEAASACLPANPKMDRAEVSGNSGQLVAAEKGREAIPAGPEGADLSHAGAGESPATNHQSVRSSSPDGSASTESAAGKVSELAQPSPPKQAEPIKAGEGVPPLSPAILSDEEVVPAFMKGKPGCLKLRDGHCKIGFATEALCAECADKRARAMA